MTRAVKRIIFFILLGVLVAGVLPWALVRLGNMFFADNPAQARLVWTIAQFTSVYERDVIYYDIGNSHYKERDYDGAAVLFQSADAVATPKTLCPIRYNWALALMDKGDNTADRGVARTAYSEALRVISINVCQTDPVYKANFESMYAQLLERLKALNNQPQETSQQNQDSQDKAEEAAKDDKQEKSAAKDYENLRRFYNNRDDGSTGKFKFVW
ncbi:MAG TPA: hypothetical protein VM581_02870 [Magnetospirillaceae bacterium]|nr:hypothetical protein [Magnetospirillaceae bacterium]